MKRSAVLGVQPNSRGKLFARLGQGWCRLWHSDITWPVNGYYECRKCGRRFPVPWEIPPTPLGVETELTQPVAGRLRALIHARA